MSIEAIATAALAIIDEEGLGALSMRRLGARLGVEGMALYYYIPSKEALLDLLVERALLFSASGAGRSDEAWDERLTGYARNLRSALQAHPRMLPLLISRPVRSKAAMEAFAEGVGGLIEAGFTPIEAYGVLQGLTLAVLGLCLAGAVDASDASRPADSRFEEILAPRLGGEAFATGQDQVFDLTITSLINGLGRLRHASPKPRE
ncbi:MAG: TetR/AcrR family transcriptional regulator C-terminal domain-containing protein [Caulobacteraceae bacterium]